MKRIFSITSPFQVPDGTLVSPFLNPLDSMSGLLPALFEGFSLASGIVQAKTRSKIHVMPFVTQVTFVRRGRLSVQMKGKGDEAPYQLWLQPDEAVVTEPGTYFQLINTEHVTAEVLYVVSPAYVFLMKGDSVAYDDSLTLEESWEDLSRNAWKPMKSWPTSGDRQAARQEIGRMPRATGLVEDKARSISVREAKSVGVGSSQVFELFRERVPELGLASAIFEGSYPPEGKGQWALNERVEEMYYVVSGEATMLFSDGMTVRLKPEVAVHIPHGIGFRVDNARRLHVVVPTGPAWRMEQHKWVQLID